MNCEAKCAPSAKLKRKAIFLILSQTCRELRPAATSSRRFDRSIRNFLLRYRRLGDSWMLFDNSGAEPTVMAFEKQGSLRIMHRELYDMLIARYGKP